MNANNQSILETMPRFNREKTNQELADYHFKKAEYYEESLQHMRKRKRPNLSTILLHETEHIRHRDLYLYYKNNL